MTQVTPRVILTPMNKRSEQRQVGDVVAPVGWLGGDSDPSGWIARLLRDEGVDLMAVDGAALERGTPVFVEATADLTEVQRRMARNHIRRLPVLSNGTLIGVVDLVDLALLDERD